MKLSKFFKSAAIVAAASLTMAQTAIAQSTILVVDQARVLRDSAAGKHVKRQIESIGKQMETEIKSQVTPLTGERDRLVAELKNISVDALKTRPDLQQRAKSLQEKGQKSQVEAAYKQRELQITEQKAIMKINKELEAILEALVKERNADIILDRSLVIYGGKTADVTDTVISRLNGKIQSVTVVRERLPRKAAGQ
ncbi:MAG: OmpH family outer membrane protein [Hyphomonadaceae bacterium]|nr:OmpH family outer membrane protein [Hyphomonadaceae bacterium]